jgi:hypothetical protein
MHTLVHPLPLLLVADSSHEIDHRLPGLGQCGLGKERGLDQLGAGVEHPRDWRLEVAVVLTQTLAQAVVGVSVRVEMDWDLLVD